MNRWLLAFLGTVWLSALAPAEETGDAARIVGAPSGPRLSGAPLERRTQEVAALLRCPVCQGLSVADSPSTLAQQMKAQVKDLLAQGYSEDQILSYYEASYGEFVRLKPPLRGVNWLVWLSPAVALVAGGAFVYRVIRSRRGSAAVMAPGEVVPERGELPADDRLARAVLTVREQVYGWPGGLPPQDGAGG